MKFINGLLELTRKFFTAPLGVAAGLLVLVLGLMSTLDIFTRLSTGSSIPGVLEYSEVLLVICVFTAFAAAQSTYSHISTNVITSRLPPKVRFVVMSLATILAVAVIVIIGIAAAFEAIHAISVGEYRYGIVRVPIWPSKVAVVIGFAAYFFEFIRTQINLIKDPKAADLEVEQVSY